MDKGIRRRDFFRVLAAGGSTAAALAGCEDKPEQLIPMLVPPEGIEYTPGNPVEYATTCGECPAGCGVVMKTREGRAIKAEGNPDHPVNRGTLCLRGQASLQTLYNPARLEAPMRRQGDQWQAVGLAEAEAAVAGALQAVADPARIVYMTDRAAGTRARFLDEWLSALGAPAKVVVEPLGYHNLRAANEKTFGRREVPQYRIDQADLLVNFGSDFLETWLSPVRQHRDYTTMHAVDGRRGGKGRFVHIGPHRSLTGANADEWIPARPGSETVLALALAARLLAERGRDVPAFELSRLEAFLRPYTLERAAEATGVPAERLERLAGALRRANRGLVLAGGTAVASESGTATQVAVNLLNYVAGHVGRTVQFGAAQELEPGTPYAEVLDVLERMRAGEVDVLIVDGANPVYHLPPEAGVGEALQQVGTIVSLSAAWDETTEAAHWVLPGLTAYEKWGDAFPQQGVYALRQPVMAPVYEGLRAAEDTLLAVGRAAGLTAFADTPTYQDYLRDAWRQIQRDTGSQGPFEDFWRRSLRDGGVFRQVAFSSTVRLNPAVLSEGLPTPRLAGEGLVLVPFPSLRHRSGEGARNPWLQEIPDPVSQVVWDTWADIHPDTARELGIAHGDRIRLGTGQGEIETAAYLHYGVHRDAIAVPMGQGHTHFGRAADGYGANVMRVLPSLADRDSGEFAYLSTRVSVAPAEGRAFLVQLDGSPRQLGRGIVQTMPLEQYAAGEAPHREHHGGGEHGDFYPAREETPGYHEPYRWGMTVDVDRCTGCSACVAACYAENNLPVVGKERAGLGREMSWIRMERFVEGSGDDARTLMQPMFCQHCSNAGCEPVCPVYATYHTPEGLNAQIYNRCVGTRYCANNCAYKVRRFNWFEPLWESPLHLQLNPDVTARTKGVMEKCTFCVQRIHRARWAANERGRDIRDGEVTPACVQTCPTQALTFGNLNDPDSRVSRIAERDKPRAERVRQYEVLEEMANLPAVTYLRKVTQDSPKEA